MHCLCFFLFRSHSMTSAFTELLGEGGLEKSMVAGKTIPGKCKHLRETLWIWIALAFSINFQRLS